MAVICPGVGHIANDCILPCPNAHRQCCAYWYCLSAYNAGSTTFTYKIAAVRCATRLVEQAVSQSFTTLSWRGIKLRPRALFEWSFFSLLFVAVFLSRCSDSLTSFLASSCSSCFQISPGNETKYYSYKRSCYSSPPSADYSIRESPRIMEAML